MVPEIGKRVAMTSAGHPLGVRPAPRSQAPTEPRGRRASWDPWAVPILFAHARGAAERFGRALGLRHPVAVFFTALIAGLLALAVISILLGLVVVHVLVGSLGLGGSDNSVNETMARHRTSLLTDVSLIGSQVGGAPVLPILAGLVALVCALARRWRIAAFAVFALLTESATYRITSLVVPRDRPGVHRLENLPVDASYPSGHTAASIAVYSGFVLLLTSRFTNSTFRALAWTFAILVTTFVALSRMYRGMHHPLDVAGGVVVGIGAVLVVLFACRAAGAVADARRRTQA
jgi:membrane-associated phospholipid phosphatase